MEQASNRDFPDGRPRRLSRGEVNGRSKHFQQSSPAKALTGGVTSILSLDRLRLQQRRDIAKIHVLSDNHDITRHELAGDPEYRGRRLGAGIGKVGDGKSRSALDHLCRRGFADRYKDE
jgi:hypothetical protein